MAPYARLGTSSEAPNIVKVWKTKDTAIVLVLAMDQQVMLIAVPGPTVPRTMITYWNLQ